MRWLKEHGVSNSLEEYLRLPLAVIDDCRLVAAVEYKAAERDAQRG